jgi:hypothetical protein
VKRLDLPDRDPEGRVRVELPELERLGRSFQQFAEEAISTLGKYQQDIIADYDR